MGSKTTVAETGWLGERNRWIYVTVAFMISMVPG